MSLPHPNLRTGNSDHSDITRDPVTQKITDWTDVTGYHHAPPVDPSRLGQRGLSKFRAGEDEIRMQVPQMPAERSSVVLKTFDEDSPDPVPPIPRWHAILYDAFLLVCLVTLVLLALHVYALAFKPEPIAPTADDFPPSRAITPTFDAYQFPPPPGPEERRLLGLEEKP